MRGFVCGFVFDWLIYIDFFFLNDRQVGVFAFICFALLLRNRNENFWKIKYHMTQKQTRMHQRGFLFILSLASLIN